jgi:uncharacterized protein
MLLETEAEARAVLSEARTIAVLGAHPESWRPASYVPAYLHSQGYRILPVNPGQVGTELWGQPVLERLDALTEPVDIVDVFRRADALPAHLDEILGMKPLPRTVWLQQGIRNDDFAARLSAAGIDVVQDRCTLADHKRWGLPRVR